MKSIRDRLRHRRQYQDRFVEFDIWFNRTEFPVSDRLPLRQGESYEEIEEADRTIDQEFLTYRFWILEKRFKIDAISTSFPPLKFPSSDSVLLLRICCSFHSNKYPEGRDRLIAERIPEIINYICNCESVDRVEMRYYDIPQGQDTERCITAQWIKTLAHPKLSIIEGRDPNGRKDQHG